MRSDDVPVTPQVAGLLLGDGRSGHTFKGGLPVFDGAGDRRNVHAPEQGDRVQTVVERRCADPGGRDMSGQVRCHPGAPASRAPGMELVLPSSIPE